MTNTHEINPPRTAIERAVIRLALGTPQLARLGTGGEAELTTSDIAAAAAGYRDSIGQHLLGVLQEDAQATRRCTRQLHIYGWGRWLGDNRQATIDVALHERLCKSAVLEFQQGSGLSIRDLKAHWQCRQERVRALMPHYLVLTRELRGRAAELGNHIARNLLDLEGVPETGT